MKLNEDIGTRIDKLSSEGDAFFEEERLDEAMLKYEEAYSLLPVPKIRWEAALWLNTAIGDVYYVCYQMEKAKHSFFDALNCDGGMVNAFVNLRMGQCLFELGDFDMCKQYLMRAYMLDSFEIFNGEDDLFKLHCKPQNGGKDAVWI